MQHAGINKKNTKRKESAKSDMSVSLEVDYQKDSLGTLARR
jgi:hypothetical protein